MLKKSPKKTGQTSFHLSEVAREALEFLKVTREEESGLPMSFSFLISELLINKAKELGFKKDSKKPIQS